MASRTDTILMYVGANVRRLRLARGWTQVELAKATKDVEVRYIQRLETGNSNPTLKVLIAVADALAVSPTDLFAAATPETRLPGRPPEK